MNSRVFRNAVISLIVLAAAAAMSTIARSGTSSPRSTASVASRLRVYDVGVSDINDRGLVVGSLKRDYDGSGRGFVGREGAWRLLGRGEWAGATRINERGQILGTSGDDGHGVLWENGKRRNLGLTSVGSLNEAGQVLGGVGTATDGYAPTPALWTNGRVRPLPFAPRHSTAMNNLGEVVGVMPDGRAAEWQDGELTDLGAGEPIALNDHGEIVGVRGDDVIVWRGGTPTDIGPGQPVALNERGDVIVSNFGVALLWRNGVMTDLGTLGGEWSVPTAISDSGQVVGYSADNRGRQYGFVWRNGTMTRLPSPPGYAGARTRALAINDRNQVIGDNCFLDCGFRMGPYSGNRFAVLWTLRGHRIETRLIWSEHRSGKEAGTPRTLAGRRVAGNGRWIAYSTAPASDAFPGYAQWGSDVFVASVGGRPKLVAGRGKAKIWNVCPAFSPNGRMLAFARVTNTVVWGGRARVALG